VGSQFLKSKRLTRLVSSNQGPAKGTRVKKSTRRRVYRFAVPGAVVAVAVAAAAVTPSLTSAQTPLLEPMTNSQLVAAVLGAHPVQYQGTVQATSNLLGSDASLLQSVGSTVDLPNGTATANVYRGSGDDLRVQVLNAQSERDLYVDGSSAWIWSSSTNEATNITGVPTVSRASQDFNPTQLADRIVADATTSQLSVGANTYVAGRAAYQLVITPAQSGSTVGRVVVAIDSTNYQVLGVSVYAKSVSGAVLSVTFSSISFGPQPSSVFAFTPPTGAKVTTESVASLASLTSSMSVQEPVATFGQGWEVVSEYNGLPSGATLSSTLKELETTATVNGVTGKLITTPLFNVFILPSGKVFAGAVTPAVLAADSTVAG